MPGVRVKEGESFENAMKRFKKQCEKALAAKKRALKKARKGMM
jgi:small subunit ribosomal protein S21